MQGLRGSEIASIWLWMFVGWMRMSFEGVIWPVVRTNK